MSNADRQSSVVEVRALSKYYGPFAAVQNVSFDIASGQIVALLGVNGAGKTTLMRMLTGYLAASEGSIRVAGCDVHRERLDAAARIGYMPENGPLYFDMTPREVLRFFGEARDLPSNGLGERIEAVAEQCGLPGILDKPIGKLSKGLRQRVGMAQALLHDPAVLIMDEPTAGLDPIQVHNFRRHVRELRLQKTLLISTHILQEVDAIADRVLVIHDGRLILDGTPADLGESGHREDRFEDLIRASEGERR